MPKCKFTVKENGREFKSIKDVAKYIAAMKYNQPTPAEVTQSEVVDMLRGVGKKINFVEEKMVNGELEEAHEYHYGNRELKPVSHVIEEKYKYLGGDPGPKGVKANEVGTNFHNIAEKVINGLNDKQSLDSLKKGHSPVEKRWIDEVASMYDEWSEGGKNVVLSEFRIGNLKRGVAGTVDVAVVYPDGSVSIHDFKATGSKYIKDSDPSIAKRRSNNYQLNLYQRMLEVGDEELGILPLKVRDTGTIIPVELDISEDGSTLISFSDPQRYNYHDKSTFKYHKQNVAEAATMFPIDNQGYEIKSLKSSAMIDWDAFLGLHLDFDFKKSPAEQSAIRYAERATINKDGRYETKIGKMTHVFKDPIAATDQTEKGKQARIDELIRTKRDMFSARRNSPAADLENYLNYGQTISFQMDDRSSSDPARMEQLTKLYKPNVDSAIFAKNIEGLENIGDDVVIIRKGYNQLTGTFASIDIITLNSDIDGKDPRPLEKGSTIAGKYISDAQAKIVAQQAGLHHVKLWTNNRENAEMLKMGVIAMHLKKENPDLQIDSLINATMGTDGAPRNIGRNMSEVMEQLKVLAAVKSDGEPITKMSYGKDNQINEMLQDKDIMNPKNYLGSNLEGYLRLVSRSLVQDVTEHQNTKKINEDLKSWTEKSRYRELLSGIFSDEGLELTMKMIKEDADQKALMTEALLTRLHDIRQEKGDDKIENDPEYQHVAMAYLELRGISTDYKSFSQLTWAMKELVTPGMSGIEMIDDAIGNTQRRIADMNRAFYQDFILESKEKHRKLFKALGVTKEQVIGNAGDIYSDMLEHREFEVRGEKGKTVTRVTGRFWPKDSPQYKKLLPEQKEYIEWYNKTVYDSMTFNMSKTKKERFDKYWKEGFIPILRPNITTRFTDMIHGKDSEGNILDKMNEWWDSTLSMFDSRDEYLENVSDNFEHIVDKMEPQKKFQGDPDEMFGDITRMKRLGIGGDGKAESTYTKHNDIKGKARKYTRTMETNLESVLGFTVMNKYRNEYLADSVDDFEAVKAVFIRMNTQQFNKPSDAESHIKYIKSFKDRNLFQKLQINKENEGMARFIRAIKTFANFAFLDYNVLSQMKNTAAGFFHTLSQGIADPKLGRKIPKAFTFVSDVRNAAFLSEMMWGMGLANADTEQLLHGFKSQMGKRGFSSGHWKNFLNYHADYYYRSVFMIANMMKDGTLDAYVKKNTPEGVVYTYNEKKDPRFKGEAGASIKKALSEQLDKEGQIVDGKLQRPYSAFEIQRMKTIANEAFEAQNTEDQSNFMNTIPGLLFGQFRGWWFQKYKRYMMKGGDIQSRKQIVTRQVTNPKTGKKEYISEYQGEYMEGIFYTLKGMFTSLRAAYDTKDVKQVKHYFTSMSEHQKQNVRRLAGDFAMLATLIALGGLMFDDDEDRDSAWYYLWYGTANEISIWQHINATPILGTGSAAASVGFLQNVITNPMETLTNPGFMKVATKSWAID